MRKVPRLVFELFQVLLIQIEDVVVAFDFGEELLGLIWFLHYVNDLHNDLENLKVGLPIYFAQVFEKDFILRIHLCVLLYVNVHYFVVEVAL